jgi:hypothetical protein
MSQSTLDTLGVIGALCGIAAFVWPVLSWLLDLGIPYIDGSTIRMTKYNLRSLKARLVWMDLLYSDPRRLSVFNTSLIIAVLIGILALAVGVVGLLATYTRILSSNIYVNGFSEIAFAVVTIYGVGSIATARSIAIYMTQPAFSSKNSLSKADKAIQRLEPTKATRDSELQNLRCYIEKIVKYGSWNSIEPDFEPSERAKALSGLVGSPLASIVTPPIA